jgi:hypothetical protein
VVQLVRTLPCHNPANNIQPGVTNPQLAVAVNFATRAIFEVTARPTLAALSLHPFHCSLAFLSAVFVAIRAA